MQHVMEDAVTSRWTAGGLYHSHCESIKEQKHHALTLSNMLWLLIQYEQRSSNLLLISVLSEKSEVLRNTPLWSQVWKVSMFIKHIALTHLLEPYFLLAFAKKASLQVPRRCTATRKESGEKMVSDCSRGNQVCTQGSLWPVTTTNCSSMQTARKGYIIFVGERITELYGEFMPNHSSAFARRILHLC